MWSSIQVLPNQAGKKSIRLKILIDESPMQSYIKNRVKLWEQIEFKCYKSIFTAILVILTDFRCNSVKQCSFT